MVASNGQQPQQAPPVRHLWIFPAALEQARALDPDATAGKLREAIIGRVPERGTMRRDRFYVAAESGWVVYVLAHRGKTRERGTNGAYKLLGVEVRK